MTKHLIFVTGTRADFGKLKPIILKTRDNRFQVSIIVTGMHMLSAFGSTREEVQKIDGIKIYEFINQKQYDDLNSILAKSVTAFADYFSGLKPDLVIVHGDRVEALAAVIAAALNNFRIAHLEGGEVSGTIDESLRHCCSKLATAHFCCSDSAAARLVSLGESPDRVFNVGSPDLDAHLAAQKIPLEEAKQYYNIPYTEFGLFSFHPVFSEQDLLKEQIALICKNLVKTNYSFVGIHPNNDPGYEIIMHEIMKLPADRFKFFPSMRFEYFSTLMRHAKIFVGNSSAGVRETPFLGLQSINIGTRQNNRATAQSIKNVSNQDLQNLEKIIIDYWGTTYPPSLEFGTGHTAENFLKIIEKETFWDLPLQKTFHNGSAKW